MKVVLRPVNSKMKRISSPKLMIHNVNLRLNLRPNLKQRSLSDNPKIPLANQKQLNPKRTLRNPPSSQLETPPNQKAASRWKEEKILLKMMNLQRINPRKRRRENQSQSQKLQRRRRLIKKPKLRPRGLRKSRESQKRKLEKQKKKLGKLKRQKRKQSVKRKRQKKQPVNQLALLLNLSNHQRSLQSKKLLLKNPQLNRNKNQLQQ